MKVREIELGDVFLASKILKKINLKSIFDEVGIANVTGFNDDQKDSVIREKAFDFFVVIMNHVDEAEKEIMALIGAWTQVSPEEARKIKLSELKTLADEFVEINGIEVITRFFKKAANLK